MEILSLPGYTSLEKRHIAKKYLVPKQIVENGLKGTGINFSDSALDTLINNYTKEAGVRNLEREIANMCRGIARDKAENKKLKKSITARDVEKRLGPPRFELDIKERTSRCGVATGLAWTSVGGDILFIEATSMPGKGILTLTGNLGQVMKESAQAALSYTRANAKKLGISSLDFSKLDLHVHVPSGAIPKDGPSAGVTMFSALVSLLSNRPVRHDVAMTGEISLRGTVLPIGGLKEKVLAAKQAGIFEVLVPERNKKDLEEIPKDIKDGVTFHFVSEMSEVLMIALAASPKSKAARKTVTAKKTAGKTPVKRGAPRKISRKKTNR
jgi:ATP-dependent Lon protease